MSFIHRHPANTGSSTIWRENSQQFFKNQIEVHSCRVLFSFHIIFPSYSGSVEKTKLEWNSLISTPAGALSITALLWGDGGTENLGFQRPRPPHLPHHRGPWRPRPPHLCWSPPEVLRSKANIVASVFSKCLGLSFTFSKMLRRN